MAHEILSGKIDAKDFEFIQTYCDKNLIRPGECVPAWLICKLINFLRLNYDFSRVERLASLCDLEFISVDEKSAVMREFNKQVSQARILRSSLEQFNLNKLRIEESNKWGLYPDFFQSLSESLKQGRGFSFVRLGDGEGNTLALRDSFRDFGVRDWSKKICDLQFGAKKPLSFSEQRTLGGHIANAALNSDFLGVIRPETLKSKIGAQTWPADRQLHGNLTCVEFVSENIENFNPAIKFIDSSVHKDRDFVGSIFEFFRGEQLVTFIGPHAEILKVTKMYDFKMSVLIEIPGEFKYFQPDANHFFDCFECVSDLIRPTYGGAPFFVGAGLLGKHYCDLAKRRGGVAIDIGSAMDDLCGFSNTRSG